MPTAAEWPDPPWLVLGVEALNDHFCKRQDFPLVKAAVQKRCLCTKSPPKEMLISRNDPKAYLPEEISGRVTLYSGDCKINVSNILKSWLDLIV